MLLCTVFSSQAQILSSYGESDKKLIFKSEMTRLWVDNAIWSRQAVLCLVDCLPGTEESLYRLLTNQEDMGRLFTRYYGREKGDEFCESISSSTSLTISIIRYKSNNNADDLNDSRDKVDVNVDRTIDYLIKVNPNWSKEELSYLMLLHSQLFDLQIQNRVTENFSYDVEVFDKIITETYKLANVLSYGIIKQFPERFE